jgi:hypothetical protein
MCDRYEFEEAYEHHDRWIEGWILEPVRKHGSAVPTH